MAELPLIRRSLIEHEALIAEAGVPELLRRTGWIKLFRSEATLAKAVREFERARQYGVDGEVLDAKAIAAREPHLTGEFAGAVHFPRPASFPIPAGWPRPMPRCSSARAGALWSAMRERSNRIRRTMARRRRRGRGDRARGRGGAGAMVRSGVSVRSAIPSRSASSAAIICIWRRAAMPCSIIPCWIPITAICWRR